MPLQSKTLELRKSIPSLLFCSSWALQANFHSGKYLIKAAVEYFPTLSKPQWNQWNLPLSMYIKDYSVDEFRSHFIYKDVIYKAKCPAYSIYHSTALQALSRWFTS